MAFVVAPRSRYSQPLAPRQVKELALVGRRLLPLVLIAALFCIAMLSFFKGGGPASAHTGALGDATAAGTADSGVAPLKQHRSARTRLAEGLPAAPPLKLLLASHGRVFWYTPSTGASQVLHEGQGVHYGAFPGERDAEGTLRTLWNVLRPHNWHPTTSEEFLLELDVDTGKEVSRVKVPSRFTHDAVRAGNTVYLADTGNGAVLELTYPSMALVRTLPLFTLRQHVNTLAPLAEGQLWAVLHNLGKSVAVRIDLRAKPPAVVQTISGVGDKAHGLVEWGGSFIMLDSDNAALVRIHSKAGQKTASGESEVLWKAPESGLFLKGLAVIDGVAYFGVSVWAERKARADPDRDSELAAFDLTQGKLLWRRTVPTHGLLNVVAAPQLGDASTYRAVHTPDDPDAPDATSLDNDDVTDAVSSSVASAAGAASGFVSAALASAAAGVTKRSAVSVTTSSAKAALDLGDAAALSATRQLTVLGYAPAVGGHWSTGLPYMSLPLKNLGSNSSAAGVAMPLGRMDITALQAKMRAMPDLMWDKRDQGKFNAIIGGRQSNMDKFKPGVDSIYLVFSDQSTQNVYRFPYYAYFKDELEPILEALVGRDGMSQVVRMQFSRMKPGTAIKMHQDMGGYAQKAHRIHIPILAPREISFQVCPALTGVRVRDESKVTETQCVALPMEEGLVMEVNNRVVHRVRNQTPTQRVQLVVDVAEDSRTPRQLPVGIKCEYENAVIRCPGMD